MSNDHGPTGFPLPDPRGRESRQPNQQQPAGPNWGPPGQGTGYGAPGGSDGRIGQAPTGQRDPLAPIAGRVPASVSIQKYQAPKDRRPLVITLAILALVVIVVIVAVRFGDQLNPTQSPNPTTAPPSASQPEPTGNAVPFTNSFDDARGVWEITDHQWTGEGLLLTVSFEVTEGTAAADFFALDNDTTNIYDPVRRSAFDALPMSEVHAGETIRGTVLFDKPRGDTTVVLANSIGRQVAALLVTG